MPARKTSAALDRDALAVAKFILAPFVTPEEVCRDNRAGVAVLCRRHGGVSEADADAALARALDALNAPARLRYEKRRAAESTIRDDALAGVRDLEKRIVVAVLLDAASQGEKITPEAIETRAREIRGALHSDLATPLVEDRNLHAQARADTSPDLDALPGVFVRLVDAKNGDTVDVKIRRSVAEARREARPNVRLTGATVRRARCASGTADIVECVAPEKTETATPEAGEILARIRRAIGPDRGKKGAARQADRRRAHLRRRALDALLTTGSVKGVAESLDMAPSSALEIINEVESLAASIGGIRFSHRDL